MKKLRWWLLVGLTVMTMACGGDVACKVTCSDVDDEAGCIAKCEELLHSGETLDEALEVE